MNFLGLEGETTHYDKAHVVVLPVPYEKTCSWKSGTARGPAAIIEASSNAEWYDEESGIDLDRMGIATLPEPPLALLDPEAMVGDLEKRADRIFQDNKILAGLGGEHTITLGFVKAALRRHPDLTLLQIDAHPDLRDEYEGRKICHATVGRRIAELAPLVQVGVRAWSREEQDFMARPKAEQIHPLVTIRAADMDRDTGWIEKAVGSLGGKVYITFDVDAFDPSVMPATGTPEPGGLSWRRAADLLARVGETKSIVGFDVVELSPIEHLHHCDYTAARLAARLIALSRVDGPH